jgi:dihydrofolate reductase
MTVTSRYASRAVIFQSMNRFSVFIATTLDGFIARGDGRIDFLSVVARDGEDYGYGKFFRTVDTLVIGRKTYEIALSFPSWPYGGKRVVVMTTRTLAPKYDETFFEGTATDLAKTLRDRKRVYVDGGSVIRQFLAEKILTDITISILPILVGGGVRLFGDLPEDVKLELVRMQSFDSDLIQLEYAPRYGVSAATGT